MMHVSVSVAVSYYNIFFFCKQNTAYEVRISDCSSDVCSPDLRDAPAARAAAETLPVSDNAVRNAARRRDVQRCTAMRASFGSGRNGRTQGEAPPGKTGDACQSGSGGGGRGGAFRRINPTVGALLVAFITPVNRVFPPLSFFFYL